MTKQNESGFQETEQPLKLRERLAYGSCDMGLNVVYGMISTLITLFYTDYIGISVASVGIVMLLSRIFDGTSDVIMGFIVNLTKSRWGKCRPWLLWMAIPYALATVAMFTVPQGSATLQFWYIFVTYNLSTTICFTAIHVPYGTLSTMMTRSSKERGMLSIFRMAMSPIGRIVTVSLTMPLVKLFGDNQTAWVKAISIWSVFAIITLLVSFFNCKERVVIEASNESKITIGKNLKALFVNKYFWAGLILWTITCVHNTVVGTVLPYYCKYIFNNDSWMYSTLYMAETVTIIVGTLLSPFFLGFMTKKRLALYGSILAILAQASFLLNMDSYAWTMGTTIIRSLGVAQLNAVVFGMFGDIVEYGQWKTHVRQESLIFGGGSLGFKVGTGITSAVIGWLLANAGYVSSTGTLVQQSDTALSMIRNIYAYGPILIWGAAIIALLLYRLDTIYPQIISDLRSRETKGQL
ncbi:MAG: MFS transporter [Lachnospiraceae bacterium]